jgi:hypothetical protein
VACTIRFRYGSHPGYSHYLGLDSLHRPSFLPLSTQPCGRRVLKSKFWMLDARLTIMFRVGQNAHPTGLGSGPLAISVDGYFHSERLGAPQLFRCMRGMIHRRREGWRPAQVPAGISPYPPAPPHPYRRELRACRVARRLLRLSPCQLKPLGPAPVSRARKRSSGRWVSWGIASRYA